MDREPQIRDLTHMAELARFHAINTFGSIPPDETEEGKREREVALFAVVHVEQMACDLEKAYDAGWPSAQSPAEVVGGAQARRSEATGAAFGPPVSFGRIRGAPLLITAILLNRWCGVAF
jgi:hypothetical protein